MSIHEVTTLLRVRDEATAVMRRYIATLREAQVQNDAALGSFRELQALMAKSLSLASREAQIRTDIAANTLRQNDAIIASRRAMLALDERSLAVQQKMAAQSAMTRGSGLRGAANRVGNDMLWTGGGILGAAAYATQRAISFNQTALETDVALGGYGRSAAQRAADIRALQRAAMAGSEATGFFTAQQILEGLKVAASSGARPLVERMGMGVFTQIAPGLARYMDVVGRLKGESADSAAMEGIRIAHMFGAYTPAAINRTLNAQAALALLMPDKMSTATTTAAYAVPSGVNLAGIPQEAILALIATADQSGLGRGRAGARLKDYIEAIAVRQSKAREAAKHTLGLSGALDSHGNLDLMKSFEILQGDARRLGPQAYRDMVRTAFGGPGSVVAAMFADPSKQAMFEANRSVISQAVSRGDLTTIQDILKGGPGGQEALMLARLNNDIIKFGQYGLPIAVKFFDTINPKLKVFGDWLDGHPQEAAKLFTDVVHVGEGLLVLGGALKAFALLSGTISAFRTLYGAVTTVGGAAAKAAPALTGVASGLRGIAGAGTAFLASPLGKIFSGAAVFFGTTSFDPQSDARKQLIQNYGYGYWRYLKGRHPGTNPYSFDRGAGDLTPQQWRDSGSPGVHVSTVNIYLPDITDGRTAAREIAARLGGLSTSQRSTIRSNPGGTTRLEPPALRYLDPLLPHNP